MSIAFCFLLTNKVVHIDVWEEFFSGVPTDLYDIYSHIKTVDTKKIPKWIIDKKIPTIKTAWCGESLISATADMFREALRNKNNKHFILLSGECIPLYSFNHIYKELMKDGRTRIDYKYDENYDSYCQSQWMSLNRDSAKVFINIEAHYGDLEKIEHTHCPDEIYPIHFLMDHLKNFDENISNKSLTYTKWSPTAMHPFKFNQVNLNDKEIRKICESKSLFARKFFKTAAGKIAMKC